MGQGQWPYQEVARYDVSVSEIQLYDMLTYEVSIIASMGGYFCPVFSGSYRPYIWPVPLRLLIVAGSFLCGDKSPPCMYVYIYISIPSPEPTRAFSWAAGAERPRRQLPRKQQRATVSAQHQVGNINKNTKTRLARQG
jgi:hypothetical protein